MRRPCPVRRKRYRSAREGRRRIQEGDAIPVPQDGQHPGTCSNCLPVPMHRQTTPHPQQRRDPVRRTFSWPLFVCNLSSRSCWRKLKRVPYPCDPSSSDPTGKRKRRGPLKPAVATEEPRVKHHHGQQRRPTMIPPWTAQPKISEESLEDAMSAEQERLSKPRASWSESSKEDGKIPGDERRSA